MKKFLIVFCFCAIITPAFAGIDQGINKGDAHLSIFGGFGAPTTKYSGITTVTDENAEIGSASFAYGAQIMYYLSKTFGLGFEFNAANFSEATYTLHAVSYTEEEKYSADRYSFMLAGKINLAPDAKTRLYIPLGVGMAKYKAKVDYKHTSLGSTTTTSSCTKPAFYAGLGLDHDINDIYIMGGELRYNGWFLDKDKFGDTSYLSDITLLLKIGIKF